MKTAVEQRILDYRQRRDALGFFDLNCWMGEPLEPAFRTFEQVGALKTGLRRFGIQRAVISHSMGVRYDAEAGNRELVSALRNDDSFYGAAILVPEMAEARSWLVLLRELIAGGVRIVRLFPSAHNFPLVGGRTGDLLEAMEQLRLPLMLWHTQTTWRDIATVCAEHPQLSVIVEGTGRKLFYDNRTYYSLLERLPNLFVETHGLTNYVGLDDAVARFGSQRFLFGSYFPHLDPNAAIMPITDGAFSEQDRHNIAHANLERLLAEVRQP